ncbi:MAG: hypothetical protein WC729_00310 [Sphingomonas sp.]|jgi:hypothetical protein|uniref:hypothetical protein n=1 Tax=Sphingomonas sp. TaxID=28214 RepID=UPI00356B53EE
MTFDLQKMLHRKGEFETARLDDFAFRARARTMRLLAEALSREPASLIGRIAEGDDTHILDILVGEGLDRGNVDQAYYLARNTAERTLRAELGDPSPVRLA